MEKQEVTVVRLDANQYQALEKKVGHIGVTSNSTVSEVAFQLGVQHVLKAVREGFTLGAHTVHQKG